VHPGDFDKSKSPRSELPQKLEFGHLCLEKLMNTVFAIKHNQAYKPLEWIFLVNISAICGGHWHSQIHAKRDK
jgi:hypothetical protein